MSAQPQPRVIAFVVTTAETPLFSSTLDAVSQQTWPVDALVVVDASSDGRLDASQLPQHVTLARTRGARNFGAALQQAIAIPVINNMLTSARWVWLLHDDSIPAVDCLKHQIAAMQDGRTIAAVGPKHVSPDGQYVYEVGISATRSARRIETSLPGEIDQGQYDGASDVLAVGSAGLLVDRRIWEELGGFDSALGPYGDGLEFGRRLRRAGHRVVVEPHAKIHHHRLSLSENPGSFTQRRQAQIYNWLLAAPWWQIPFLFLWLSIWSPVRALGRLILRQSDYALSEITSWLGLIAHTPHLLARRIANHRASTIPASALRPLEATTRDIRERRLMLRKGQENTGKDSVDASLHNSLHSFRTASLSSVAGVGILSLIVTVIAGWGLWGGITSGAWLHAPSAGQAWDAAWSTWILGGDGHLGPPDPWTTLMGTLSLIVGKIGISPEHFLTALLLLSLLASAASAWALVSSLTAHLPTRVLLTLSWATVPALTVSVATGRLSSALIHVFLPIAILAWIRLVAPLPELALSTESGPPEKVVAYRKPRRHGWMGIAALSGLVLTASLPSFGIVALLTFLLSLPWTRRRGGALIVTMLPALILSAPFVATAFSIPGGWRALVAPAGIPQHFEHARSWELLLGLPLTATDSVSSPAAYFAAYWPTLTSILLLAIATVSAVRALRNTSEKTPNYLLTVGPLVIAAIGYGGGWLTSFITVGVDLTENMRLVPVAPWPAPWLSLALCALLVSVASRIPGGHLWAGEDPQAAWDDPVWRRYTRGARGMLLLPGISMLIAVSTAVGFLPLPFSAPTVMASRGSDVPAVTAHGQSTPRAGKALILTPTRSEDGHDSMNVDLWRHPGPTFAESSALTHWNELRSLTSGTLDPARVDLMEATLTITTYPDLATVERLTDHGVDTLILRGERGALNGDVKRALDRAPGVQRVADTETGTVWRLRSSRRTPARVTLRSNREWVSVDGQKGNIAAQVTVPKGATSLVLAERADPGWKASLNGVDLQRADHPWASVWNLPEKLPQDEATLTVAHSTWWAAVWKWGSITAAVWALLVALPVGRKM